MAGSPALLFKMKDGPQGCGYIGESYLSAKLRLLLPGTVCESGFWYATTDRNTCYRCIDLFRMGHAFQRVGQPRNCRVTNTPALRTKGSFTVAMVVRSYDSAFIGESSPARQESDQLLDMSYQRLAIHHRLPLYSITSSSWVPSTVPPSRSSVMWSQ